MLATSSVLLAVAATLPLSQRADPCDEVRNWSERYETRCEVREYTLTGLASLTVDGGSNGGIAVEAWDQPSIRVRAVVVTRARSVERTQEMARDVEVSANSSNLHASGPSTGRNESWYVTWRISAPAGTNLDLQATNGGITVTRMHGTTRFHVTNGGIVLHDLAGDVQGSTVNGGLHIALGGSRWDGSGMDVTTTNGGVTVEIPDDYSGEFETGTVNGGLNVDFPVTVQGRFGGRRLRFSLGSGGPLVRARTTNGGVRLSRT